MGGSIPQAAPQAGPHELRYQMLSKGLQTPLGTPRKQDLLPRTVSFNTEIPRNPNIKSLKLQDFRQTADERDAKDQGALGRYITYPRERQIAEPDYWPDIYSEMG